MKFEVWNNTTQGKLAGPAFKAHEDFITFTSREAAEAWKIEHCDKRQELYKFAPDNIMTYEIRETS